MPGSPETGPTVTVRRFAEGFNNGDVDLAQSACAGECSIIDDFPPFRWEGSGATSRWYRDMAEMAGRYGMSDWSVGLEQPRHLIASDRLAYVVVPVVARWLEDGSPAERTGYLTAALGELVEGWRITAFAWAWS